MPLSPWLRRGFGGVLVSGVLGVGRVCCCGLVALTERDRGVAPLALKTNFIIRGIAPKPGGLAGFAGGSAGWVGGAVGRATRETRRRVEWGASGDCSGTMGASCARVRGGRRWWVFCAWALILLGAAGCDRGRGTQSEGVADGGVVTVYSGRTEALVSPVIARFTEETGIRVRVQYGETSQLAAMLLEEGTRTPAQVFWSQDAATMGLLAREGRLSRLPEEVLGPVPERFRHREGRWVGVSGRARVLAYHPDRVEVSSLPARLEDLVSEVWRGRLGWAPTNASFQAATAAMLTLSGPEATRAWLEGIHGLSPRAYPSNTPAVLAVHAGEVDAVLTNHYYLHRLQAEHGAAFRVRNHYLRCGEAGSFVSVATVGILEGATGPSRDAAERFVAWLLSTESQEHFALVNHEFPMVSGVAVAEGMPTTEALNAPQVDLAHTESLEGVLRLMRDTRVLR